MKVTFVGTCKNCGTQLEITDSQEDQLNICETKLMCPTCGCEFSAPTIERLDRIAEKIHSSALSVEPFQLNSITVTSNPEDLEHQRARQSECDFLQSRLKELEAEAADRR